MVYILVVLFLVLDPWGMVRSITGGLKGSPLSEGISYLLSLGLGIVAVIYGYTVDLYRTDRDIIKGMSYSSVRFSGYCVTLFLLFSSSLPCITRDWMFFRTLFKVFSSSLYHMLHTSLVPPEKYFG